MKEKTVIKKLTVSVAGAAFLTAGALMNTHEVKAATNRKPVNGVLHVRYNGKGKVRLLDGNGHYQNRYLNKNTAWKVFEKATINGQTMYRLGSDKQWIPEHYTDMTTASHITSSASKATNRKSLSGVIYVTYNGKGKVRLLNSAGQYQNQYVSRNSSWKVFEQATINGQTMYRIGSDSQWIPAHFASFAANRPASSSSNNHTVHAHWTDLNGNPINNPNQKPNNNHNQELSGTGNWSQAQIQEAKQEFVNYVNNWRQSKGLAPFTWDTSSWLQQGAEVRAQDNHQMFMQSGSISHTRPNGQDYDDAFHSEVGSIGGENIGYVGNSKGYTPKQAADLIAQGFIDEGPTGGHYQVLAIPGVKPMIGVGFSVAQRNGQYVYILNMETGTNVRLVSDVSIDTGKDDYEWAQKWIGKVVPNITHYAHHVNGRIVVHRSEFEDSMGSGPDVNSIKDNELPEYWNEMCNYLKQKYNAIID